MEIVRYEAQGLYEGVTVSVTCNGPQRQWFIHAEGDVDGLTIEVHWMVDHRRATSQVLDRVEAAIRGWPRALDSFADDALRITRQQTSWP